MTVTKAFPLGRTKNDRLSIGQKKGGARRAPFYDVPQDRGCVPRAPGGVGAPSGYAPSEQARGDQGSKAGGALSRL